MNILFRFFLKVIRVTSYGPCVMKKYALIQCGLLLKCYIAYMAKNRQSNSLENC